MDITIAIMLVQLLKLKRAENGIHTIMPSNMLGFNPHEFKNKNTDKLLMLHDLKYPTHRDILCILILQGSL